MKTVFENGQLFVGDGRIIVGASIVVEDNKIIDVGTGIRTPGGASVIDCSGKTVMPGLIDCEVHICTARELRFSSETLEKRAMLTVTHAHTTLEAGFTTIRDCGSQPYLNMDLRDIINSGWVDGPRIVAAGTMRITGGHGGEGFQVADGAEECRKIARDFLDHGADIVKCMATGGISDATNPTAFAYDETEMAAAFKEAHKVGKSTSALAYGAEGIKNAIRAGADCIQHGNYLDDECIKMMVDRGVFLVPTLSLRLLREQHPEIVSRGYPEYSYRKNLDLLRHMRETKNIQKAFKAGVKIALGTDWPEEVATHGENAQEFDGLIQLAGMTPSEALVSATKTAAQCCGLGQKLGTLEAGKLADIIVVNGDPVRNTSLLKDKHNITLIMKDGKIFSKKD